MNENPIDQIIELEIQAIRNAAAEEREQAKRLREIADKMEANAKVTEEKLGDYERRGIPIDGDFDIAVGGRALMKVSLEALREHYGPEADAVEIHYIDWLRLVKRAGHRIRGKDEKGTFLAMLQRCPEAERVQPRSGMYKVELSG